MPIFDYQCPKCGAMKEDVSERTFAVFCVCGEKMKKLPPRVNAKFVGKGFYENDYKKKN